MTAGNYDIVIEQGATFNLPITWKDQNNNPINLSGFTANMMMRATPSDTSSFINLTTSNGGITLGGSAGTIAIYMSSAATAAITQTHGVYDLILTDNSGNVTRLLQGNVIINQDVTR